MNRMWTMEQGLVVVRTLQPLAQLFGYHIALGGGVLNRGASDKDLDLYFLPRLGVAHRPQQLLIRLASRWGEEQRIGSDGAEEQGVYEYKVQFNALGKRIDVFVVKE